MRRVVGRSCWSTPRPGRRRWCETDERGNLGAIRPAVAYAAETGRDEPRHMDVFAHIVPAAIDQVALMIARADDRAEASCG